MRSGTKRARPPGRAGRGRKPRRFASAVGYALAGLAELWRFEPNARMHAVAALGAVGCGIGFGIGRWEWVAVVLCIGFVIAAELCNTAVERLADAVTAARDPRVGAAKDCAAAAVLVASATSATVGVLVFWPHAAPLLGGLWDAARFW